MRISDWSSDVCDSDLFWRTGSPDRANRAGRRPPPCSPRCSPPASASRRFSRSDRIRRWQDIHPAAHPARKDRKSVVYGTSVSVGVDIGGCRIINKKQQHTSYYYTLLSLLTYIQSTLRLY